MKTAIHFFLLQFKCHITLKRQPLWFLFYLALLFLYNSPQFAFHNYLRKCLLNEHIPHYIAIFINTLFINRSLTSLKSKSIFQSSFIASLKFPVFLLMFFTINTLHLAIFTSNRDKQRRWKSTCGEVFKMLNHVLEYLPAWSNFFLMIIIWKEKLLSFILQIRKLSLK